MSVGAVGVRHPRYPVYVISKGRSDACLTSRFLAAGGVQHVVAVEPQEADSYRATVGAERVVALPFRDLGLGSVPVRNWCWEDSLAKGHARHWVIDDNIRCVYRLWRGKRVVCAPGPALAACEDFVDRYENVAVAGLNYASFVGACIHKTRLPPFYLNRHVYSCLLIQNDLPVRWRGRYNEDTDLCLSVLSRGWCTVAFNAFSIAKMATMTMRGGNTDQLYSGDGRLKMARSLERAWPHVVETKRRWGRPQHVVRDAWDGFDTPLRIRTGVEVPRGTDDYGLAIRQVKPTVRSERVKRLLER